jgi:hypothetical protein
VSNSISENIELIRSFVEKWQGMRVARSEIAHLDVQKKETERLEFMRCIFRHIRTAIPEASGHQTGSIRTPCRLI